MNAVGYARLSDKKDSSNSIKSQCRRIEEYCTYHKLTLLQIFIDDGKSAWTFDRKGFVQLEAFCRQRQHVEYLIIVHFDRFSRADPIDAMTMERTFRTRLAIKVLQVTEPPDTDVNNEMFLMMRFMQAFAANQERQRGVDRTIQGMRQSLLDGRFVNMAPYGYTNARDAMDKPILVIENWKADIVRYIFDEYLRGANMEEIRTAVKAMGYNQQGNSAINNILTNPVYAGLLNVKAYKNHPAKMVKGIHEALISEHDYWLVQDKISGRNFRHSNNEDVPLRGVIKCHCGKHMTAGASKGRHGKYYWYYFCNVHRKENYSAAKMHAQLLNILDALTLSQKDAEDLREYLKHAINDCINSATKELMNLNLAIQKVQQSIVHIEEKYLTSATSAETYARVLGEKQRELAALQQDKATTSLDGAEYWRRMEVVLSGITSLRTTYENFDLLGKQNFLKQGFDCNMYYQGGVYRTPYLHPMFNYNPLILKEKGLIVTNQPGEKFASKRVSAPSGSWHEKLNLYLQIEKLFVVTRTA